MRTALLTCMFVTIGWLSSLASAQESTREEFNEFCQAVSGRWIGEITWAADSPGFGKKGDKVTTYWEGKITEDGNALLSKFYGGNGSGTSLAVFDASAKQIKWLWINSGGSITHNTIYMKDGQFLDIQSGSHADGTKTDGKMVLTIEENGSKHTWRGSGSIGGKKHDDYTDVWRRQSK